MRTSLLVLAAAILAAMSPAFAQDACPNRGQLDTLYCDADKDLVADLRAGYALYLAEEKGHSKGEQLASLYMPPYITQFLHVGEPAWEALGEAFVWLSDIARSDPDATGLSDEALKTEPHIETVESWCRPLYDDTTFWQALRGAIEAFNSGKLV